MSYRYLSFLQVRQICVNVDTKSLSKNFKTLAQNLIPNGSWPSNHWVICQVLCLLYYSGISFNGLSLTHQLFYRPQTKFAKVMFLHLSVSHSVHKGEGVPGQVHPPGKYTPPGRFTPSPWQVHPAGQVHPPRQVHPQAGKPPGHSVRWDMVNNRAVRIPLECILVLNRIRRT